MILPIVRLYATAQQANDAIARVRANGLPGSQINLVGPTSAASEDGLVSAIAKGNVLLAHAKVYAKKVKAGHFLVSVSAPGGTGRLYAGTLDASGPSDSGIQETFPGRVWEEAAPFSSAFGLPILSKPSMYNFAGIEAVDRTGKTTSANWGLPEIASSSLAIFGNPKMSRNPAPFSSLFHIPVIL